MAFKEFGSLNPHGAPILRRDIITNSVTITEMDSVKLVSGFVAAGTTGALVQGHVVSISTNKGLGLLTTGAAGAEIGSYVGTFAAASNNQTVSKVKADVDVSKYTIYSVNPNATIGTTVGSNLAGYKTDIVSATQTLESNAALIPAQYNILGVDPTVPANQLVNIYESNVFGV